MMKISTFVRSLMVRMLALCVLTCLGTTCTFAAATLLPNGQQCFQSTSPTSGGLSGPIATLGTVSGGSSYTNNVYTNVPLTGGSGFGATANITVTGNAVVNVTIINPGTHYAAGDTLSAATANLGGAGSGFSVPTVTVSTTGTGMIGLLGAITGGSGGTNGTYPGVALTGGSGSGATANITVSGGAVTAVAILNAGLGYQVADTLSAASGSIGGTTGFSVPISSVAINQSLAGGSVGMYVPNSLTPKQTWKNAAQTILNTNPVTLDQNGCAIIYGTGSYRQILKDSLGDTVWDQITTDTSAQQNVFWAGLATGTPNTITLTDPGFSGTDGSIVNFQALNSNTGATTVNPSGFGNVPVLKDTILGTQTLSGMEFIANNPISLLYTANDASFHILNPVTNTQFSPPETVKCNPTQAGAPTQDCAVLALGGSPSVFNAPNANGTYISPSTAVINFCQFWVAGCTIGGGSSYTSQQLFAATTAGPPNQQESQVMTVLFANSGFYTNWHQSTAYTAGRFVTANGNMFTETVAFCTSSNAGSGPSGTGSGITDGTCSWNYAGNASAGSKQSGNFNTIANSGAGHVWGLTSEVILNSGWVSDFATGAEIDAVLASNVNTNFGPNNAQVFNLFLGGFNNFPITAALLISPNQSSGFAAHYGIILNGVNPFDTASIFDNSTGAITSLSIGGSQTAEAISLNSTAGVGVNITGTYTTAINIPSTTNNSLAFGGNIVAHGSNGVSCGPGLPTNMFASVAGIVTHC